MYINPEEVTILLAIDKGNIDLAWNNMKQYLLIILDTKYNKKVIIWQYS
jgi:hypothetical protein